MWFWPQFNCFDFCYCGACAALIPLWVVFYLFVCCWGEQGAQHQRGDKQREINMQRFNVTIVMQTQIRTKQFVLSRDVLLIVGFFCF